MSLEKLEKHISASSPGLENISPANKTKAAKSTLGFAEKIKKGLRIGLATLMPFMSAQMPTEVQAKDGVNTSQDVTATPQKNPDQDSDGFLSEDELSDGLKAGTLIETSPILVESSPDNVIEKLENYLKTIKDKSSEEIKKLRDEIYAKAAGDGFNLDGEILKIAKSSADIIKSEQHPEWFNTRSVPSKNRKNTRVHVLTPESGVDASKITASNIVVERLKSGINNISTFEATVDLLEAERNGTIKFYESTRPEKSFFHKLFKQLKPKMTEYSYDVPMVYGGWLESGDGFGKIKAGTKFLKIKIEDALKDVAVKKFIEENGGVEKYTIKINGIPSFVVKADCVNPVFVLARLNCGVDSCEVPRD